VSEETHAAGEASQKKPFGSERERERELWEGAHTTRIIGTKERARGRDAKKEKNVAWNKRRVVLRRLFHSRCIYFGEFAVVQ
jgi:hypothetical protein